MIFGTGSVKFERSGSEVLLENCLIEPNYTLRNIGIRTAVYDHYHTYEFHGDYSEFTVRLNLWKYDSPTTKYNEIYPYLYKYVYFWPHADGNAISGSDGNHVAFFINSIKHEYLLNDEADAGEDVLYINFKSVDYTNITGSIL